MIHTLSDLFDQDWFVPMDEYEKLVFLECLVKCNALGVYTHEHEDAFKDAPFSDRVIHDGKEVYFKDFFTFQPINESTRSKAKEDWSSIKSDKIKEVLRDALKEEKIPFEKVWSMYPRNEKKQLAKQRWDKMSRSNQDVVINHLPKWLPHQDENYLPHFSTYISNKRYLDPLPKQAVAKKIVHSPEQVKSMFE